MSYQVLARKWRPKSFSELVGQEHVVTVLTNALTQQRLHHAYLFTGTRGVGKTTIARIFAKSLNCEQGITENPCGQCNACIDIDAGRFVDLLEIDAASKTKVDDTREILDNVQYKPSRGRYKVYLIDEVHMLSRSSFNALLKTLEEPPEHVKFILATTDPQKLPITVLSRCLQFHLKALMPKQIESQLVKILSAENVSFDDGTLPLLAKAAQGSMRDSLSLTDQAIAQGQGHLTLANIQQMLGGVNRDWVYQILILLVKNDSKKLMELSLDIASYAPSYSRVMAELLQLLHQIALSQITESHFELSPEYTKLLLKLCQAISPEDVQLYYQIVLNGRKDLPYAVDEQAAFDMILLRMLAFKPQTSALGVNENNLRQEGSEPVNFDDIDLSKNNFTKEQEVADDASDNKQTHISPVVENSSKELIEQDPEIGITHEVDDSKEILLAQQVSAIENQAKEQGFEAKIANQYVDVDSLTSNPNNDSIEQPIPDKNQANAPALQGEQTLNLVNANKHVDNNIQGSSAPQNESSQQLTQEGLIPQGSALQASAQQENNQTTLENTPTYSSPAEQVIAERNMLRSRRKAMENDEKKSSNAEAKLNEAPEVQTKVKPVNVPDIATVPDEPFVPDVVNPAVVTKANQVDKWANMIDTMALGGRIRQLAIHSTIAPESTDDLLILKLDQSTKHLNSDAAHKQLQASLSELLEREITVELEIVENTKDDPFQIQTHINEKRQEYAIELINNDGLVHQFKERFQAEINQESIAAR